MSLRISAAVCTYNRREVLVDAVQSLVDQDLPPADFEIVVVDNNSTDGAFEAVEARFGRVSNLRLYREAKQGIAPTRNAAARACQSPIVAYLDDDALAPPDWLRSYLALFAKLDPTPGVIGGDMTPLFVEDRPRWLTDELLRPLSAGLRWFDEPRYLDLGCREFLCEANSAYRVKPLFEVGGFPENLGRVGESLTSGENYVNVVLQHAGYPLYYDPGLVVQHRIPKGRLTRSWFRRRMFWQGVSQYRVREYLAARGIEENVFRPLDLPCSPDDWVDLFDDGVDVEAFPRVLESILHMGYVFAAQNLMSGR
jgi:glycosyltransferase involved in cell wall biosynthesis